jgi:hypothetical protein
VEQGGAGSIRVTGLAGLPVVGLAPRLMPAPSLPSASDPTRGRRPECHPPSPWSDRPAGSSSFAAVISNSFWTAARIHRPEPDSRTTSRARPPRARSQNRPIHKPRPVFERRERREYPVPLQRGDPLGPIRRVTLYRHESASSSNASSCRAPVFERSSDNRIAQ